MNSQGDKINWAMARQDEASQNLILFWIDR